jgi:hypothetical protein
MESNSEATPTYRLANCHDGLAKGNWLGNDSYATKDTTLLVQVRIGLRKSPVRQLPSQSWT